MTALLVSFLIWVIVAFMATDDHCRTKEKRALGFFVVVGVILTTVGVWRFEKAELGHVSIHDWVLLGFFPLFVVGLAMRARLVKIQSEVSGKECSLLELNLAEVPDRNLVNRFRIVNKLMWTYVAGIVLMQLGRAGGLQI